MLGVNGGFGMTTLQERPATKPRDRYYIGNRDMTLSDTNLHYDLRVKDMPDEERPREKLLAQGPQGLSLAELLSILWGVGSRSEDVLAMAKRTLREYGEKTISHELNPHQLAKAADIPLGKACQVVVSFELGRRFFDKRAGKPVQVRTLQQAQSYLRDMGSYRKEQLRGLYLDSRYQVIHDEVISIGSLTASIIHPREIFRPAIERGAVAVIIAHNHPSGELDPTMADLQATEQIVAAGEVLGIPLLDHLIVTATGCISIIDHE